MRVIRSIIRNFLVGTGIITNCCPYVANKEYLNLWRVYISLIVATNNNKCKYWVLEVHIFCIFCIMQKMPKQKIFCKKWMQKNAIKENHDFSLILAKYSLILQKIRLHWKYFLSNIETRLILHTITPLKHLKK